MDEETITLDVLRWKYIGVMIGIIDFIKDICFNIMYQHLYSYNVFFLWFSVFFPFSLVYADCTSI